MCNVPSFTSICQHMIFCWWIHRQLKFEYAGIQPAPWRLEIVQNMYWTLLTQHASYTIEQTFIKHSDRFYQQFYDKNITVML